MVSGIHKVHVPYLTGKWFNGSWSSIFGLLMSAQGSCNGVIIWEEFIDDSVENDDAPVNILSLRKADPGVLQCRGFIWLTENWCHKGLVEALIKTGFLSGCHMKRFCFQINSSVTKSRFWLQKQCQDILTVVEYFQQTIFFFSTEFFCLVLDAEWPDYNLENAVFWAFSVACSWTFSRLHWTGDSSDWVFCLPN